MNQKRNPKILFVTIPTAENVNIYPPVGVMSVITALSKAGFGNTKLINIEFLRISIDEALAYIEDEKPDILGISAVVSMAYDYTKSLSLEVKKRLPDTTIVVGGSLAASAEVVLKKTGVDFACIGEGEQAMVDFVNCWLTAESKEDFNSICGWAFLDNKKELVVTPFQDPLDVEEVYDIDWSLIDSKEERDFFFPTLEMVPITLRQFSHDPRVFEPHRKGKRVAIITASKGCVARCTFCHRFDKGIRYIPIPTLMKRVDFVIRERNTGFILFSDENFGTDRKWLAHFTEEIAKRDILWRVQGMRVNTINPESITKMKKAGCVSILFGMESGSQKMLDVMEKRTTVEQNRTTVKLLAEHNLSTILQLIIGMPGETPETVKATTEFACYFVEQSPGTDFNEISINFAQAVPGTPLYEIARHKGDIGQSLEDEEEYLMSISDRDTQGGEKMLNFTEYPTLELEKWYFTFQSKVRYAYKNKWGLKNYYKIILNSPKFKFLIEDDDQFRMTKTGVFSGSAQQHEMRNGEIEIPRVQEDPDLSNSLDALKRLIPSVWTLIKRGSLSTSATLYPDFFERFQFLDTVFVVANLVRKHGVFHASKLFAEYIVWRFRSSLAIRKLKFAPKYISLRKELLNKPFPEIEGDNPAMAPLRKGR